MNVYFLGEWLNRKPSWAYYIAGPKSFGWASHGGSIAPFTEGRRIYRPQLWFTWTCSSRRVFSSWILPHLENNIANTLVTKLSQLLRSSYFRLLTFLTHEIGLIIRLIQNIWFPWWGAWAIRYIFWSWPTQKSLSTHFERRKKSIDSIIARDASPTPMSCSSLPLIP